MQQAMRDATPQADHRHGMACGVRGWRVFELRYAANGRGASKQVAPHHGQHAGCHVCASATERVHIATHLGIHSALYDRIASPQFARSFRECQTRSASDPAGRAIRAARTTREWLLVYH